MDQRCIVSPDLCSRRNRSPNSCWLSVYITSPLCPPAVEIVTAGGLGGMAYWVVIFPVDVVKSAMQTDAIVKTDRKFPDMLTTTQVLRSSCAPRGSGTRTANSGPLQSR